MLRIGEAYYPGEEDVDLFGLGQETWSVPGKKLTVPQEGGVLEYKYNGGMIFTPSQWDQFWDDIHQRQVAESDRRMGAGVKGAVGIGFMGGLVVAVMGGALLGLWK